MSEEELHAVWQEEWERAQAALREYVVTGSPEAHRMYARCQAREQLAYELWLRAWRTKIALTELQEVPAT